MTLERRDTKPLFFPFNFKGNRTSFFLFLNKKKHNSRPDLTSSWHHPSQAHWVGYQTFGLFLGTSQCLTWKEGQSQQNKINKSHFINSQQTEVRKKNGKICYICYISLSVCSKEKKMIRSLYFISGL
jgi:hypothetical protein